MLQSEPDSTEIGPFVIFFSMTLVMVQKKILLQ